MIICENKSPLFIEIINLSLDILLGLLYSVCYFSGWNIYGNVCYLCELWYLTTAALSMPNKCECLRSRLYVSTNNRSTKRKSASNLLIMSVLLSPGCQKQVNNTICSFVEAIPQTAVPFEPFWFSEMRIFDIDVYLTRLVMRRYTILTMDGPQKLYGG